MIKQALILSLLVAALFAPAPSHAQCDLCETDVIEHVQTRQKISEEHNDTREFISQEFSDQESWLDDIFANYLQPAWRGMAQQFTLTALTQVTAVGAFLDAENQLETQRLYQELAARAHKDYRPSTGMCVIGTNVRDLASAGRQAEMTAHALGQRSQRRQLGHINSAAAEGEHIDRRNRMEQFRRRYCDAYDNNGQAALCDTKEVKPETVNKDIDFTRTLGTPASLELDFSDSTLTDDEEDVTALAANLYSHRIFFRPSESMLASEASRQKIMDMRSVVAKRSVAEASFNAIAGLKSRGSAAGSAPYMAAILNQLGTSAAEITALIGDRPSYDAQMEVLARRLYQNPAFYADLYDSPANVTRKKVAMQAIGLMQDYDTLQSYLRTEMMLSVLLEMEIMKLQKEVQNRINGLRTGGNG